MHRLFVAIRPPAAIRARLLAAMGGISGARWQTDDQIHLTLRFIGEVDRHAAGDIDAALASIHHPRFDIALSGLGAFHRRSQAEIVWVGAVPVEPLRTLHKKIDRAIARLGLEPERRSFAPHVTLARLKRSAGPVKDLLEAAGGMQTAPFPVDHFLLYESKLTPDGAVYAELERYRLD